VKTCEALGTCSLYNLVWLGLDWCGNIICWWLGLDWCGNIICWWLGLFELFARFV